MNVNDGNFFSEENFDRSGFQNVPDPNPNHSDPIDPSNGSPPPGDPYVSPPRKETYPNPETSQDDLIALRLSTNDAHFLMGLIPELRSVTQKLAFFHFKEKIIATLEEERLAGWFRRFFLLFLTGIIILFNSQTVKFVWIDEDDWPIPLWALIVIGYAIIYLIDWAISELVTSSLLKKLRNNVRTWLDEFKFTPQDDHPLKTVFNQTLEAEFKRWIEPYSENKLWLLLLVLVLVILSVEALVSFHLMWKEHSEDFPWYLRLTPLMSASLNVITGIIKGLWIKYPQELKKIKLKILS